MKQFRNATIRDAASRAIPPGRTMAIITKGDEDLLKLDGHTAWHFPRDAAGNYAGYHPADSFEAIAHLRSLLRLGLQYLVVPVSAFWWFDYYAEFAEHLAENSRIVAADPDSCVIFDLQNSDGIQADVSSRNRSLLAPIFRAAKQTLIDRHKWSAPLVLKQAAAPVIEAHNMASKARHKNRSKLRVLFVAHNHPAIRPGGAEVYALELYQALRETAQFEPMFVARADAGNGHQAGSFTRLEDDPGQFLFHTCRSDFDLLFMTTREAGLYRRPFREFLQATRPDIVHFQHTLFLGYDLVAEARQTLPDAAIFYTLQEYLPICHHDGQMVRMQNNEVCSAASSDDCHTCFPGVSRDSFVARREFIASCFEFVDMFIAPSRFLLERFVEWGIPREKIRFEDYGRRLSGVDHCPPRGGMPNRLGFFGQVNPYKGVDVLLRALEQMDDVRLWIHGANLDVQRGGFREEIHELLARAGDRVTFGGPYSRADVPRLMANVDWVVVPSIWWENSPLVIQEAFGNRRPVICSGIGGMAEKVADGINGLHFSAGDAGSLVRTLRKACGSRRLWKQLQAGIDAPHPMAAHVGSLSSMYEEVRVRRRTQQSRGSVLAPVSPISR